MGYDTLNTFPNLNHNTNKEVNKEANYVEIEKNVPIIMAQAEQHETKMSHVWFLDPRYSNHMCGHLDIFSRFTQNFLSSCEA